MAPAPPRVCQGAWDQPLPPEGGGRAHFVPVNLSFSSLSVVLSCPPPHVPLAGAVAVSLCPLCVSSLSLPPLLPALGALAIGGGAGFALQDQGEHPKPWLGATWLCPAFFWLRSTFLVHSWGATLLLSLSCASSARLPRCTGLKNAATGLQGAKKTVGTAPKICCPGMRAAQGTDPAGSGL